MAVTHQQSEQLEETEKRVAEFICALPPDADWQPHPSGDGILIVHPDHPARWLKMDGSIQEIEPCDE